MCIVAPPRKIPAGVYNNCEISEKICIIIFQYLFHTHIFTFMFVIIYLLLILCSLT